MKTRAEWCPCARGGRGGWGFFGPRDAVKARPKPEKVARRLIAQAREAMQCQQESA